MKLNFGENIRKLRIEHGLTQEKLADFLGVSFQAVSKWERGDTVPDIFMLPTIAAFFGVTTDHLLCFDQIEMEKDIEKYEALYYQLWQKNDREALLKKNARGSPTISRRISSARQIFECHGVVCRCFE